MTRILLAALLSTAAAAADPVFDLDRVRADIRELSSDAYEGRAPATPGETKTIAFIARRMQEAGLQPGGANGSWYQDVPLLKADIVGTPALTLTLDGTATKLTQGEEIAVRAAMTGDTRVALTNVPLVFVGYGVKAPERQWDDLKGTDVRGKMLVVLVNDPDFEGGEGEFGGKAMTYYGRWTYKYEEAARLGAAGVMIVHETAPAAYGWATVKNSNTNSMFDIVRANPRSAHTPVESWIQLDLAKRIFAASGLDFDAAKAAAKRKDFRPVPLKATFSADYQVKPERIVSKNVLGKLPGTTRPAETVFYTAHWDHLGVGLPDAKGDRIYNGALDNASGTATLIEMGRAFAAAPRTARTLVFMAVTAEEKGLLGSEYYAANPLYPLAKTAGVINTDSPVGPGAARDFTISGLAKLELLDMLVAEGQARGRSYTPDPRAEAGAFYRSDHFPFAKVGVPAISFGAGSDLVQGGVEAGRAWRETYTRDRYHQPADEFATLGDMASLPGDLALLYATGRTLADGAMWPNWSQDSEFRAARDRTAAERR